MMENARHTPSNHKIFVFGSNLAGRHGKGAALYAYRFCGALYGRAEGHHGRSYAIPTKGALLETLPLNLIAIYVRKFLAYARSRPELEFFVSEIGTGLAGYQAKQIAPMFSNAPSNVELPQTFKVILDEQP